jgi:hypothetical protein
MRKIRLDIEKLNVETFHTVEAEQGEGTVRGNELSAAVSGCVCPAPDPTADGRSCPRTLCGNTCGGSVTLACGTCTLLEY